MAERRSWVDVKMVWEGAVSGNHGRTGWRRGMRGGVIGLVFVRRRRISYVFAMSGERRRERHLARNLFLYDIHVSFVH
jgi:hypothetical protein